ncbi:MAG: class I SAM-dependent methyltransferase [Desulfovibrio sp.]|jgi:SAM-dependent methyltransferase|nr:class I SAM-dependent methyltransferase [Desulfovibrio sp.]
MTDAPPFAELWAALRERGIDEERAFWDDRAEEFNAFVHNRAGEDSPADFLQERGALFPGAEVLDIGCGAGRHALDFAGRGARVTGLDISPLMIGHAGANARESGLNIRFITMPWEDADIEALGLERAFDLVVSVRSPAINSRETLMKMCRASRAYCFLSAFIHRDDMLLAPVAERVAPGRMLHRHVGGALYAFNILCSCGICPGFYRRGATWSREIGREEAVELWAGALGPHLADAGMRVEDLPALLPAADGNGRLCRTIRAETAWIFWKI